MPFAITHISSLENQSGTSLLRDIGASQTREIRYFSTVKLSPLLLLITRLSFAGGSGSESRAADAVPRASLIFRGRFSRDSTRNAERSESPRRIARRFAERAVFHSRPPPLFGVPRRARMCARDTAHDGMVSRPRPFFHEKSLTKTKNRRQSDRAWRRDNAPLLLGFALLDYTCAYMKRVIMLSYYARV